MDNSQISQSLIVKPKQKSRCQMNLNSFRAIEESIQTLPLTSIQKSILELRFISLLHKYRKRSMYYSCSFNSLRITISIGSLIVPALLSVQYTPGSGSGQGGISDMNVSMYWIVWTLSLLVTISNAFIALLKVDKKYYTLNTTYQHLLSEGWQFIELSGKYSGFYVPSEVSTHQNQFIFFCNILEKIRMRNVQDEFYKVDDHTQSGKTESIVPPTPLKVLPFSSVEKSDLIVNGGEDTPSVTGTTVRKQNTAIASAITPFGSGSSPSGVTPFGSSPSGVTPTGGSGIYESP